LLSSRQFLLLLNLGSCSQASPPGTFLADIGLQGCMKPRGHLK
jgi:hypothetical protein